MTSTPRDTSRPTPKAGILDITAYKPGRAHAEGVKDPVKLSANENILGSSPKAREAFVEGAMKLHLYPDGRANGLREVIGEHYDLDPDRLTFGCGSDEIFALLNQVYLEPGDNIVQGEYGFAAFAIGARACQGEVRFAKEPDLRIDVAEVLACVDDRTRLVFIANPSNPTGTWLTAEEIGALHAGLPSHVLLVLDGAYSEFATDPAFSDGLDLARTAPNVIVTHTFSKIHGLGSLRIGWGYAASPIIEALERIRPPFNTTIAGQEAAIAALHDEDFQKASVAHIEKWRPWLFQQLGGLGLECTPSATNFLLVKFPKNPGKTAIEAEAFLASRGLLVRGVAGYGLPLYLRITIGLEQHNRALVETLTDFMNA